VQTSLSIPRDLPSVEETLRLLAGALKTAVQPGLNRVEVQRLQAVSTIAKAYKEALAEYINYREIEKKLKEMEELYAQVLREKSQGSSTQPNSAPVE
jgi:hypothetical protein